MFNAKFNYESRFFADGYELSGIENLSFSYTNPTSVGKSMGITNGFILLNGPASQQVAISRFLTYNDPVLNYTGESPISGSLYYDDNHYGFQSGYLLDYSLNCAVGSVPRVNASFQIADELQSGIVSSLDENVHPDIDIPTQGSIFITSDNSTSNRVIGFDYSIKCNRRAYLGIGRKNIADIELLYPIEYSATVQIDVDDAFMEKSNSFLDKTGDRNISIVVNGRNGSEIQNVEIPNASLVGENLTAASNGSLKLNLQYVGHIGKDLSNFNYLKTFVTAENESIISSRLTSVESGWQKNNQDVYGLFMGENLDKIGEDAFLNCSNLSDNLFFPYNLESIGDRAFSGCSGAQEVFFDGEVITGIGEEVFKDCSSLEGSLYLPDSITEIGKDSFANCFSFDGGLKIPENINNISDGLFKNCYGFEGDLNIPDSASYIGKESFLNCSGFDGRLKIGQSVQNIGDLAFSGCSSLSGPLAIPNSTTGIGVSAYDGCSSLESLTFGNSLKVIDQKSFLNCSGINGALRFPRSLETIGSNAFENCDIDSRIFFFDDDIVYFNSFEQYQFGKIPPQRTVSVGLRRRVRYSYPQLNDRGFSTSIDRKGSSYVPFFEIIESPKEKFMQGQRSLKINGNVGRSTTTTLVLSSMPTAGTFYIDIAFKTKNCEFRIWRNNDIIFSQTQTTAQRFELYNSFSKGDVIKLEIYNANISTEKDVIISDITIRRSKKLIGQPFNLKEIGVSAFQNSNLRNYVAITEGVQVRTSGFRSCKNISRLSFGKDVQIYNNAFRDCENLQGDIIFHDSTENIGAAAFLGNSKLGGSLYLPSGLTFLGNRAFKNCSFLGNLAISQCSGLKEIKEETFLNCKFTNRLYLPDSLEKIKSKSFTNCKFTGDLILPSGLTEIGFQAFYGNKINDVYSDVPNSIYKDKEGQESIDSDIFFNAGGEMYVTSRYYNDYLKALEFNGYNLSQDELLFQNMPLKKGSQNTQVYRVSDGLVLKQTNLDIPANWYENQGTLSFVDIGKDCSLIGDFAFRNSSMSGDLVMPAALKEIENRAFENTTFNGYLSLNDGLERIGGLAFNGCDGFTGDLILPNSLVDIGQQAFKNCSGFNGALVLPENIKRIRVSTFENTTGLNSEINLPTGIRSIDDFSFKNCGFQGRLVMPFVLTGVGNSAFENTDIRSAVNFSRRIRKIGNNAFKNCKKIVQFNCSSEGESLEIGSSAFEGCEGINRKLIIRNRVTSVGQDAFRNCTNLSVCTSNVPQSRLGLKALQFQDQPTSNNFLYIPPSRISDYQNAPGQIAFGYYDGNLIRPKKANKFNTIYYDENFQILDQAEWDDFTVPINWKSSGNGSFIDFGESVIEIGSRAFLDNDQISGAVLFPDSLRTINANAFQQCSNVQNFIMNSNLENISGIAFAGCSSVKYYDLPENLVNLGKIQFANNLSVEKINCLGYGLETFGYPELEGDITSMVENCHKLSSVDIGNYDNDQGVTNGVLKQYAFTKCGRDVSNGKVVIANSIDQIGNNCFDGTIEKGNYPWIETAVISARLLKKEAFINQTNMTSFGINFNLRVIEENALANCSSLSNFRFRGSNLGSYALSGCSSLRRVTLQPSLGEKMYVSNNAFSKAGELTVSPSLVKIYKNVVIYTNAFRNRVGNSWISSLDSDSSFIGIDAFRDQTSITNITFGPNTSRIKNRAFMGCTNINGDIIFTNPRARTESLAFDGCPVNDVYYNTHRDNVSGDAFNDMNGTFYITQEFRYSWPLSFFDNNRPIAIWTSYPDPMI